jgi:RimJ/RimL family protein N-acetyltransferase
MIVSLAHTPVLHTDRLILRAPIASDWPHWRDFMASDRSSFVRPGDPDDAKAWRSMGHVIGMWVMRGYGSFVYCLKGSDAPLGLCGPWHPVDWPEREIGWTVWTAEAEGKGYAYEAASAARDHAFGVLKWDTAVSYIDPANDRSIALALRLGARRDTEAAIPDPEETTLVYRHPKPEGPA